MCVFRVRVGGDFLEVEVVVTAYKTSIRVSNMAKTRKRTLYLEKN